MRYFAYEWVTAGGFDADRSNSVDLSTALRAEGWAMLKALASDLAALPAVDGKPVEVHVIRHAGLPVDEELPVRATCVGHADEEQAAFCRLAAEADLTIIVAPETDGCLLQRVQLARRHGAVLACDDASLQAAADKHLLAERLSGRVPLPAGTRLLDWQRWPTEIRCPAVLKPADGAGSQDTFLLRHPQLPSRSDSATRFRLERHCKGQAVSVAVLCGPAGNIALPACEQRLSNDDRLRYQGGRCPLPHTWANRAEALALRAVDALGGCRGYVGVDLVLGASIDGSEDFVVEINPRLTTSYVGLRALLQPNLAELMLHVAAGRPVDLATHRHTVEFEPTGRVRVLAEK